jgi:plastocyanin
VQQMHRLRASLALGSGLLVLLATFLTASPAAAASKGPRTWHAIVGVETSDHAIQGMAFLPKNIYIDVGDTVVWTAKSAEIHTVTFLATGQPQVPFSGAPDQVTPAGGDTFNGTSTYYNSGLLDNMTGDVHTYQLTFAVAGNFNYICWVHENMGGTVHVRPAGTPYPFTQAQYDRQDERATDKLIDHGYDLADQASDLANRHTVIVGYGDDHIDLMRFFHSKTFIDVGDTVTFKNMSMMEPHTVTFGTEQPDVFDPYGNPTAYDGSYPLNSGYIGVGFPFGTTFSVTFTKAGKYPYFCALHDVMGMVGEIVVKP